MSLRSIPLEQQREWIAALKAGRLDVFQTVFETYWPLLHHFASIWLPASMADDVIQDIMFDVWQRRTSLREENLSGYLLAAVRYRVIDVRRRWDVERRLEHGGDSDTPPGMGTRTPDADVEAEHDDLRRALTRTLRQLPELQRAVMMLRWTQDMSFAEIAKTLGISENAAMQHASRGRRALVPLMQSFRDG